MAAFRLQFIPNDEAVSNVAPMNTEQATVHRIVLRYADRAVRYYTSTSPEDAITTMSEMMNT